MLSTGIILVYADEAKEPLIQQSIADYTLAQGDYLYVYEQGSATGIQVVDDCVVEMHGGTTTNISVLAATSDKNSPALMKVFDGSAVSNVTVTGIFMAFQNANASGVTGTGSGRIIASNAEIRNLELFDKSSLNLTAGALTVAILNNGTKGVLDGGTQVSGLVLHKGASMIIGSNITFCGTISISAKLTQNESSNASNAIMNFLLIEMEQDGEALFDWNKAAFGAIALTVSEKQAEGRYLLASNALEFSAPIILSCGEYAVMALGSDTAVYHNRSYCFSLDNGTLCVAVSSFETTSSSDALTWANINGASSYVLELMDGTQSIALNLEWENAEFFGLANGDYTWRVRNAAESDNWQNGQAFSQTEATEGPQELVAAGEAPTALFFAKAEGIWGNGYIAQNILTGETARLAGKAKITDIFKGSDNASILMLDAFASSTCSVPEAQASGVALFLDDIYSTAPGSAERARLSKIDTIIASTGDDIVDLTSARYALTGNVTILGGDGDDVIWANGGDDVLCGGAGNDTLHGGGGKDIFCFGENWGNDTIGQLADKDDTVTLWFSQSSETLQLSFAAQGDDTLITAALGDTIRAVGMSLSIDDCRFGATGYETEYNILASSGVFA